MFPGSRQLAATLMFAVADTGSAALSSANAPFVGLPVNYRRNDFPDFPTLYTDGGVQLLLAQHQGGPVQRFLVVARDARTGRTLWKTYGTGIGHFEQVVAGQGGVFVESVTTGAITRGHQLLLNVQTGAIIRNGLFSIPAVQDGLALTLDNADIPISAAFLSDPTRLIGQVIHLRSGQIVTRDFPIPPRPRCGNLKTLVISSHSQQFIMRNGRLEANRQDNCGQFTVSFEWWKSPLPQPTIRLGK